MTRRFSGSAASYWRKARSAAYLGLEVAEQRLAGFVSARRRLGFRFPGGLRRGLAFGPAAPYWTDTPVRPQAYAPP